MLRKIRVGKTNLAGSAPRAHAILDPANQRLANPGPLRW